MLMSWLAQSGSTLWMPPPASDIAGPVDWLFYFILYTSYFFLALIIALMVFFAIKYRRRDPREMGSGPTHGMVLELTWTIIPLIIVMFIFFNAIPDYYLSEGDRTNQLEINVTGSKWQWDFQYDNNLHHGELHLPVNRPIRLNINSTDVVHSVYIPAFRAKKDAVPGRSNYMTFTPTRVGTYPLLCAEFCGTQHSDMLAKVVVHPKGGYEKWLAEAARSFLSELDETQYEQWKLLVTPEDLDNFLAQYPELEEFEDKLTTPAMYGEELYTKAGCNQCHSIDGTSNTGPTFKGMYGRTIRGETVFKDDTKLETYFNADYAAENYFLESIHEPGAKVVKGMKDTMPAQKGKISEQEVGALIAFFKTLESGQ
ncbi:MAG: cytochrome c oxidase subunit II [Planctomycetaceae bacterium]|nr:cytochrome c oxidase subunit II [Planctomycetaceae bacterium]